MKREDYNRRKRKLTKLIKTKKDEWGQETIGYELEGDFYIYPKFQAPSKLTKKDKEFLSYMAKKTRFVEQGKLTQLQFEKDVKRYKDTHRIDTDKDGIPDKDDCEPLNPKKQGKFHDVVNKLDDMHKKHIEKKHEKERMKREKGTEERLARIKELKEETEKYRAEAELKKEVLKEEAEILRLQKELKQLKGKGKIKEFLQKPSTKKTIKKAGTEVKKVFKDFL